VDLTKPLTFIFDRQNWFCGARNIWILTTWVILKWLLRLLDLNLCKQQFDDINSSIQVQFSWKYLNSALKARNSLSNFTASWIVNFDHSLWIGNVQLLILTFLVLFFEPVLNPSRMRSFQWFQIQMLIPIDHHLVLLQAKLPLKLL
jgi:hypothetical protein